MFFHVGGFPRSVKGEWRPNLRLSPHWGGDYCETRSQNYDLKRIKSTPDPDTFEKYRDTPPICIVILLQKYALRFAESSIYTTNLYLDPPPICIAMLLQKY